MKKEINRRHVLSGMAALGALGSLGIADGAPAQTQTQSDPIDLTIVDVQMLELTGKGRQKSLYLKLITDSGLEGLYGPIDTEAAVFVDRSFAKRLLKTDGLEIEAHWDRMFKANRHARGSHYLLGMSAVDNALWDLKARALGLPVYKLLGGSRKELRAYASCLGFSQEPSALQSRALALKQEGYAHQKWFINKRGPKLGAKGVMQDVEVLRLLREAVGDDVDLMFDASRKWDLQYTVAWAKRAEQYHPLWIEEPLQSTNLDALTELSRETSVPVAMGEHFYGRWDVQNYLKDDTIRVIQADPEWCGGVSELIKICTLASVHGAHVIPHGHSIHAAKHVVASQPIEVCPLVEYLIQKMQGDYYYFEKDIPAPKNGIFTLSDRPGFGIELDESKIVSMRQVHWDRNS